MRLRSTANGGRRAAGAPVANPAEDLGDHLVRTGQLTRADVEEIVAHQGASGRSFGDAAVDLGKIDRATLDRALAERDQPLVLSPGDQRIDPAVTAAFDIDHPTVRQVRAIRGELAGRWRGEGPDAGRAAALIGFDGDPRVGETAANLAVVSAQLGWTTLLVDGDMEQPLQHHLFRLPNTAGVTSLLTGAAAQPASTPIDRLKVLPTGPVSASSAGLLERQPLLRLLSQGGLHQRLTLFSQSRLSSNSLGSLETVLAGFDAVIFLVTRHASSLRQLQNLIADAEARGLPFLGSVILQ
jgi:hypothetical protein